MLTNIDKNFKETCYLCGKKVEKTKLPSEDQEDQKTRWSSRIMAIPAVRKDIKMPIDETKGKMQVKHQRSGKTRAKIEGLK